MAKLKAYTPIRIKGLKKLSGDGDRFDAFGVFIKVVIVGEFKGMALVRIGSTHLHVPLDKIEEC